VSQASDTGQSSIVFLGRESFRMQVVGADAIPSRVWDGPTERIIERRTKDRRRSRGDGSVEAPSTPALAWNTIVAVSLATFACGVLATLAVERLARHPRADVITHAALRPPLPLAPVVQLLPKSELAPGAQPLPPPSPEPRPRRALAVAKTPPASVVRTRRPAPSKAAAATEVEPIEPPPAGTTTARKWVDPFAD
jgi:hypothetical protein